MLNRPLPPVDMVIPDVVVNECLLCRFVYGAMHDVCSYAVAGYGLLSQFHQPPLQYMGISPHRWISRYAYMSTSESLKKLLGQTLQLGKLADTLTRDSMPELDSMAVVTILTAMEEQFNFIVEDDDISADTFATFGSLVDFVEAKLT